jgi:hypothetical protein
MSGSQSLCYDVEVFRLDQRLPRVNIAAKRFRACVQLRPYSAASA